MLDSLLLALSLSLSLTQLNSRLIFCFVVFFELSFVYIHFYLELICGITRCHVTVHSHMSVSLVAVQRSLDYSEGIQHVHTAVAALIY